MGEVQHGRGSFGLGTSKPTWYRATPAQKRGLVVKEIQQQEAGRTMCKGSLTGKTGPMMGKP